MGGILSIVVEALPLLVQAAKAGSDVWGIVNQIQTAHASNDDPTSDQWQAVNKSIAELRARLHRDPPQG